MQVKLDPERLTFGDMEDFETEVGASLMETINKFPDVPAKELIGLVWICGRTDDPAFTLDAARKLRIGDIAFEVGPVDPTDDGD